MSLLTLMLLALAVSDIFFFTEQYTIEHGASAPSNMKKLNHFSINEYTQNRVGLDRTYTWRKMGALFSR